MANDRRKVVSVLLVDDQEEHFLASAARAFRRLVPDVYTAQDGSRALEVARENVPDLIIVDQRMPGMTGLETIAALQSVCPDAFVILHSGIDDDSLNDSAREAGADACVAKPASAAELLALAEASYATLASITRAAIERTLGECGGNKTEAARRLGVSRRGLQKMLNKGGGVVHGRDHRTATGASGCRVFHMRGGFGVMVLSALIACGGNHPNAPDAVGDATADGAQNVCDAMGLSETYIKPSHIVSGYAFGEVLALSADGSTLAVGVSDDPSGAAGVDGNQLDTSAPSSGAVFVFARVAGAWSQIAYVKASNPQTSAAFGLAVALSRDGNTLAVGAPYEASAATGIDGNQLDRSAAEAGAVYVFARVGSTWSQQAYVKASNTDPSDMFGSAIALSGDGATMIVGAPGESSSASGIGGDQADNSRVGTGAVYVFTRAGATWAQHAYVKPSNPIALSHFGRTVACAADGLTFAAARGLPNDIGTDSAGTAYLFARGAVGWTEQAVLHPATGEARFGTCLALSVDGNMFVAGAPGSFPSGTAFVFARAAGLWNQDALLAGPSPSAGLGDSCAITNDGDTIAFGAPGDASAARGLCGDPMALTNEYGGAGAAYLFSRTGSAWTQRTYIKASNTDPGDGFGASIAIANDGTTLAIGAPLEWSAATGIDGDQSDNSMRGAGAVYVLQ